MGPTHGVLGEPTLVLNRSPGLDVDEGQRAAEVRFARFFNNTPVAIATVNRAGRVVQSNAPFTRLFGTLPRSGEGEGPTIVSAFRDGEGPQAASQVSSRWISKVGCMTRPFTSAVMWRKVERQ